MVTGCRKLCLRGAFNTSEEKNRTPLPPRLHFRSVSSRRRTKTSGEHETEPPSLFGQGVRTRGDQSGPIIMCLWSANYL